MNRILLLRAAWLTRAATLLVAVGCGTAFGLGADYVVMRMFTDVALEGSTAPGGSIQAAVTVGCGLVVGGGIIRLAWRSLGSAWVDWVGPWPR